MLEKFKESGKSTTHDLLKSILKSALYGIMAFKAVRNKENEITDFECLYINDIAEEIIGKKAHEIEGSNYLEAMPDSLKDEVFENYRKVVETGKFLTFEQTHQKKKIKKWYRIAAISLDDGFTATFQDITDLKESLLEAKSREKKYQQLFEESLDAIVLVNDRFDIIETNTAFEELFGYDKEELVCMTFADIFELGDDFNLFGKMLLEKGKLEEYEVELKDKYDKNKSCLVNITSITEENYEKNSYLGVIRDMTKRKQADKEMMIAERLSMTGKIARTIAHEIRNPLTNLTLALQQLKDEISDEIPDSELYLDIIKRNADRIGNLITDLLNSSKTKKLKLTKKSLNTVMKEAISLVEDRLKLRKIKLRENYDANLPEFQLDGNQLKVAILNLFINAIEAMEPNKGVLTVTTRYNKENIEVLVEDNGKGISPEHMDKLFEPFFTAKKKGTGLGLTNVQNIIHSHKGQIEAESEVGVGTKFHITFKLKS